MHKFNVLNEAHLRKLPASLPIAELDVRIAADPFAVFAIAWEAEFALVRMTIPWCALAPYCACKPPCLSSPRVCRVPRHMQHQAEDAEVWRYAQQGPLRLCAQQAHPAAALSSQARRGRRHLLFEANARWRE
eukprot:3903965-Prymnesium_polylepis.2